MKIDWAVVSEAMHLHLRPASFRHLCQNRFFGATLVKVVPAAVDPGASVAAVELHNHVWNQLRVTLPGRLTEVVFDSAAADGLRARRVKPLSYVQSDVFLGGLGVRKTTWVLVLRGRMVGKAGVLSDYAGGAGQASFTPLVEAPSLIKEPDKIVA